MPGLRHLNLGGNPIFGGEAFAGLIASPHFPELAVLQLDSCSVRGLGPKSWPKKGRGPSLRHLQLDVNTLSGPEAERLFARPELKGLWVLEASHCDLTDRGLRTIAKNLDQLVILYLHGNPISGAALAELVNRPAAAALQWLSLDNVKLDAAGVNALVKSEHLKRLKRLSASGRGRARLMKRFGPKVLK